MKKPTILIGVCASIAAYRACDIVNHLRREKIETIVCMSRDAHHFITPLVMQALSGNRVFQDMFQAQSEWDPAHISLAEKADAVLVVPATSDVISKVANGICDDLLTCTIASADRPVLFAPAMNTRMYKNKILQANITSLKKLGYNFIGPVKGRLACGTSGIGHIAATKEILKYAKTLLK